MFIRDSQKINGLFSFGIAFSLLFTGFGNGFRVNELEEKIDYLQRGRIKAEVAIDEFEGNRFKGRFFGNNIDFLLSEQWQGFLDPVTEKERYIAERMKRDGCPDLESERMKTFNLRRISKSMMEGEKVEASFKYDEEEGYFFIHRLILKE